jgi:hypothetical protein
MSLKKLVVVAVLGLLTLGGSTASATTLRTDPGGGLLTGSTTVTNTSSGAAVWQSNFGSITCTQSSFDATVSANSSATSIGGTLTGLTYTSCHDTVPSFTFTSCALHQPGVPTVTITGSAGGGSLAINDATIRCPVGGGFACYFTAASAVGTVSNAASTLSYSNVGSISVFPTSDALGGPSICSSTQTFSVTFNHLVQGGTNRTVTVGTT